MNRKTIHGIDLTAPSGLEALFAYRRAQFGDAMMMADGGDGGEGGDAGAGEGNDGGNAGTDGTEGAGKGNLWDDPAKAKAEIERLRKENGNARTSAKQQAAQEARDELLTKLGLKDGDKPVDAEELARQLAAKDTDLSAKDQKIRALTVENALSKAARRAHADEDLLIAVLAHKGTLNDLDPSEKDFTKKLDALVKAELDENPKLKAVLAAGASGADLTGGSGEKRNRSNVTLDGALTSHYGK